MSTTIEDENLSSIFSSLDIGQSSVYHESDTLDDFKAEFLNFLSNNPHIVNNSKFVSAHNKSLVVLSPLSAKHQFGRSWVSKSYISTIVERPERLLACSIGIAAAVSMYPAHYTLMASTKKSPLTSPHVLKIHGKNWPADIEKLCEESEAKLLKNELEVPEKWDSGDLYLTKGSLDALTGVIGAIETAVDNIFKWDTDTPRRAFVSIRPPGHHSHPCTPSGFCLINNAHIAIEYAANTQDVTHAVILDIDLHHGDGTQDICWQKAGFQPEFGEKRAGYNDDLPEQDYAPKEESDSPNVGYFSLHDINSYPTELGFAYPSNIKNASTCLMAHDLHIWNVHLEKYEKEEEFYEQYREKYSILFKKAEEYLINAKKEHDAQINSAQGKRNKNNKPFKAMVVISAGFDASEYEVQTMQRHGVHVPTSFYAKFTSDAVKLANKHSNGVLLSLLEGGYSDGALSSGVFSHLIGLQSQQWQHGWGTLEVVKELVRGCRPKWTPLKVPSTDVKRWANQVIKLGRVMIPQFIIEPIKVTHNSEEPIKESRVTRSRSKAPEVQRIVKEEVTDESVNSSLTLVKEEPATTKVEIVNQPSPILQTETLKKEDVETPKTEGTD